jgi:hypothetical protein
MNPMKIIVDDFKIGIDDSRGMSAVEAFNRQQTAQLVGHLGGHPDIILIRKEDILGCLGSSDSHELCEIPDHPQSAVVVYNTSDSLIGSDKTQDDVRRAVLRAVVANKQGPVRNGLSLNTPDLLFNEPSAIIGSQDNVDAQ